MVGLRVGTAAVDHSTYSAMQVGKQNAMIRFLHVQLIVHLWIGYALTADLSAPLAPLQCFLQF